MLEILQELYADIKDEAEAIKNYHNILLMIRDFYEESENKEELETIANKIDEIIGEEQVHITELTQLYYMLKEKV